MNGSRDRWWLLLLAIALLLSGQGAWGAAASPQAMAPSRFFKPNDTLGFIGAADCVAIQESGHLEAELTMIYPGYRLRFRNLAWEGDTVFAQPRDFNFPNLTNLLRRFEINILIASFGQSESLQATQSIRGFVEAYERLLESIQRQVPRVILITPTPFEKPPGLSPDLTSRNPILSEYAQAIRELGARRGIPVMDAFGLLSRIGSAGKVPRWTEDGMHLNERGQQMAAEVIARAFTSANPGSNLPDDLNSTALHPWTGDKESLRRAIVAKNRLWFDYWRPMNWAFLDGDRTEQPSSRDHLNPQIRWFPTEMELFVPLIYRAEMDINKMASKLGSAPRFP